jgi:two-component system response regulator CpxR
MSNASILIVDDDQELGEMLTEYLHSSNYGVVIENDGLAALKRTENEQFDLIILDVMLPSLDGFDVLRRLRTSLTTPIIMLTARGDEVDCILGLELGADDYLSKPFNPRQLIARVRAVLRRSEKQTGTATQPIAVGSLLLNSENMRATIGGSPLSLTGTEFRLLEVLMEAAGRTQSREHLSERVLGRALSTYDRSIDTHVSNLRRKLLANKDAPVEIRSIRGAGYVLVNTGSPP